MRSRDICYLPIDELMTNVGFLILRAVRWFDWASSDEITIALNIPSDDVDRQRRNRFDVELSRLARHGYLERTGTRMTFVYRLTAAGRAEYARQLQRGAL